jgi:predicted ATPase
MVEADASEGREYRMLGPLAALDGGVELALGAPKQRALLATLLLHGGRSVPRARLIDTLWGDHPPESAVNSLQLYVHGLRRTLGADAIETQGTGYRLAMGGGRLDLDRFRSLVADARAALQDGRPAVAATSVSEALALWRGPALSDLEGEPVMLDAAALDDLHIDAIELRGDVELALGRHRELLADLEPAIELHPYRERLREQLLLALYRSGRQKEALERYQAVRTLLRDELGIEPGPRLRAMERSMLQQDPALDAPTPPAPASALPAPLTPLVGRRRELDEVAALLDDEGARLVTLTGPGGTGKTRLGLAVAERLQPRYAGGAVFVDLSSLTDPQLVGSALAEALGVEGSEASLAVAALRDRGPSLIVFDNFEHVLDGAPLVTGLLKGVPRLSVLTTSRTPLRLGGEYVYAVPPLELPPEGADLAAVLESDAGRLFAERARAAAQVRLDDDAAAAVARLCRRLDGLPLAIELAAVRCGAMPLDDIVSRIDQALELLADGPRDAPARQQTLRAAIDWSYRLLDAGQRGVFERLSVFAGGFDVSAADAVADAAAVTLPALVEAALLQPPRTAGRLGMLQTIRGYAGERLAASSGTDDARSRHRAHYLAQAESAAAVIMTGADSTAQYEWFELEHDNLRAALDSAADQGDTAALVALAVAMRQFWVVRGHLAEGRRAFARVIDLTADAPPRLRAPALRNGGTFSYRQGALEEARSRWQAALGLYRELGDEDGIGACTAELGAIALEDGDLPGATALYEEAAEGFAAAGNRTRLGIVFANLAEIEQYAGRLEQAGHYAEQATAVQRELGDVDSLAVTVHNHARIQLAQGDLDGCRRLLLEAIDLAQSVGYREVIAYCVEAVAELALSDGDPASGMRMLGAADHQFTLMGAKMALPEQRTRDAAEQRLRAELGADAAEKLHRAGASADLDELLAEVRQLTLHELPR